MRKLLIALGIAILLVGTAIYGFFTYGGHTPTSHSSNAELLQTANVNMTKGDPNAPVKMVEYADILCPYCAKANEQVMPQLESDYVDKGKLHVEIRLVGMISPDSQRAGEGAYCAAEQNKFWEYIDTAYETTWTNYYSNNKTPQDVLLFSQGRIESFAKGLPLDMIRWNDCMASDRYVSVLDDNHKKMTEIKAYGTPEFIINDQSYNGAPPYEAFKAVIDGELRKADQ